MPVQLLALSTKPCCHLKASDIQSWAVQACKFVALPKLQLEYLPAHTILVDPNQQGAISTHWKISISAQARQEHRQFLGGRLQVVPVVDPDVAQVPRDPVGGNFANCPGSVSACAAADAYKACHCHFSNSLLQDREGAFLLKNL